MPRLAVPSSDEPAGGLPYEVLGTDPVDTWTDALIEHGSGPGRPDAGGVYSTQCIAHVDDTPSLRWHVARDGRVIFFCHAGCEFVDILRAAHLEAWALQRVKTIYTYKDRVSNPVYQVVRTTTTKGKAFKQQHYDPLKQEWVLGRGDTPDLLWRLDEALAWAKQAEAGATLYLTEGEKDAILLAGEVEPQDFATSSAGGAAKWSDDLTKQVLEIVESGTDIKVQVVADSDQAGNNRARMLVQLLDGQGVKVSAVTVDADAGFKDIGQVIDRFGREWLRYVVDLSEDLMTQPWDETGGLCLADHPGVPGGKAFHHTIGRGQTVEIVLRSPCAIKPMYVVMAGDNSHVEGWVCQIADPYNKKPRQEIVYAESLSTKPKFDNFRSLLGIPPAGNPGSVPFHEQLDAFLRFHGRKLPKARSLQREGWNRHENEWALVDGGTGTVVLGTGHPHTHKNPGLFYGTEISPEETARRVAEASHFRDYTEAGPIMSWVAAYLMQPVLWSLGFKDRPVLAITGRSGIGKSRNPYLGFAGLAHSHEATPAGMMQMLRDRSLIGLDDQRMSDGIGEAIRQATAQDTMAARGTPEQRAQIRKSEGWVVYSGEDQPWINERAHLERTVHVNLTKEVQGRTWSNGESQWPEVAQYIGKGFGTECAGTLARELNAQAARMYQTLAQSSGARGIAGYQMCLIGIEVLCEWLKDYGYTAESANLLAGTVEWVERAEHRAEARKVGGVGQTLTDLVIPAFLAWAPGFAISPLYVDVRQFTKEKIQEAVRVAYTGGYKSASAVDKPPVIVVMHQGEGHVLWNSKLLAMWVADVSGGQRSATIRGTRPELLSATSLTAQTGAVQTAPIWNNNPQLTVCGTRSRYTMASDGVSAWLLSRTSDTGGIG